MEKPVDNGDIGFSASSGLPPGRELIAETEDALRAEVNACASDFIRTETLPSVFSRVAEARPDGVALESGVRQYTYTELDGHTNRLANALRAHGLSQGDPVGIYADRSVEAVVAALAILKAGGAYVPLDVNAPQARIRFVLEDAAVAIVIAPPDQIAELSGKTSASLLPVDLDMDGADSEDLHFNSPATPTDTAYIMYTSGSTGTPKGVCVEHRNILRLVFGQHYATFGPDKTFLFHAPLSFDASTFEIWGALLHGARLVVAPAGLLGLHELADEIRSHHITTLWLTAPLFHEMVDSDALSRIGCVSELLAGGDVLSPEHVRRALTALPNTTIINGYGPTECTTFACCHRISDPSQVESPLPIGIPIAHTPVYILDESGMQAPIGTPGEICIGGDGVATGYLNRPDLTGERFVADPYSDSGHARMFRTGDRGRIRHDGLVEFLGRTDNQVKIRGFRVELDEIEAVLRQHTDVLDAAARVVETGLDRRIVGYAISRPNTPHDSEQLLAYLRDRLPAYMVPHSIVWIAEFPLTPSGKVDRRALPMPSPDRASDGQPELNGDVEHQLATIWLSILPVDRVERSDDFFELGGNSLLAMRLANRVRSRFSVDLPIRRVFEMSRLSEMAEWIDQEPKSAPSSFAPIQPVARGVWAPLTYSQEQLWFLQQLQPELCAYNVPVLVQLTGLVDDGRMRAAIQAVAARHEALRTTFRSIEGAPYQWVQDSFEIPFECIDVAHLDPAVAALAADDGIGQAVKTTFDLETGPLVRTYLYRVASNDTRLLLVVHHIVIDGWSLAPLVQDLAEAYRALEEGCTPEFLPLRVQMVDLAHWQKTWYATHRLAQDVEFWKRELHEFDADITRPRVGTNSGVQTSGVMRALLPSVTALSIDRHCRERKISRFAFLFAIWQILLGRYTASTDILTATGIASRDWNDLEPVVGFFVNTVLLRTRIDNELSVSELVCQVHECIANAREHQYLSLGKIVEAIAPDRHGNPNPFVRSMFVLQNAPNVKVSLANGPVTVEVLHNGGTKFDLLLEAYETGAEVTFRLEYSERDYTPDTARDLMNNYTAMLTAASQAPESRIGSLSTLDSVQLNRYLEICRGPRRNYCGYSTVVDLLDAQCTKTPDQIAVRDDTHSLTYRSFTDQANRLANYIRSEDVPLGSVVGVLLERSIDFVVAAHAILRTGSAYLPLDLSQPEHRLAAMLKDAQPKAVITRATLGRRLPDDAPTSICIDTASDEIANASANTPKVSILPESMAYVIFTSGSTGTPKGAANSHGALCNRILWMQDSIPLTTRDVVLHKTPAGFDVSVWELFGPLSTGASIFVASPDGHRDPAYLAESVQNNHVTTAHFVPSMLREFLAFPGTTKCKSLERIFSGGEQLAPELARLFHSVLTCDLYNLYGPAETAVDVTAFRYNPEDDRSNIPIGRPVANTSIYILDSELRPVPIGVAGEIFIGGTQVGLGYINRPELTDKCFLPDPFYPDGDRLMYRTGDLGRYLPDDNIEYLGRLDNQVKLRGQRIELEDIDIAISAHEAVRAAATRIWSDDTRGDYLAGYYVCDSALPEDELRAFLKSRLPAHMLPRVLARIPELPLSPNGKMDRKSLPDPTEHIRLTSTATGAPRTDAERTLASIWEHLLATGPVGFEDEFFLLGGHSLLATRLVAQIDRVFGIRIPVRRVFEHPRLDALAQHIEDLILQELEASEVVQQSSPETDASQR